MDDRLISDDELDALLTARDPLDSDLLDSESVSGLLNELRSQLPRSETPRPVKSVHRSRINLRPRRLVVAALVVVVIAIVASLIGIGGSSPNNGLPGWLLRVSPAQATTLNRLAAAAAQQSGPGKGQWLFEKYLASGGGGAGYVKTMVNYHDSWTEQQWTSPTGANRERDAYTGFSFDSATDRANYYGPDHSRIAPLITGAPGTKQVSDIARPPLPGSASGASTQVPDTALGILNTFKKTFAQQVREAPKKDRAGIRSEFGEQLFEQIASILQSSLSETERAAALKAIAYDKGAQVLGTRRDAIGRSGIALEYVWNHGSGQRMTLIVDAKTGNLLEQVTAALRPLGGTRAADFEQRFVYLQRAIVSSMTALPGGATQPYAGLPVTPSKVAKGAK